MNKIGVYVLTLGPVQTNVYIAYNKESLECFIVDPSAQAGNIIDTIKEHNLKPVAILLTHGHFDHIMAVNELVKEYNIKVYISKFDDEMLYDSRKSGGSSFIGSGYVTKADVLLNDGDVLHLLDKLRDIQKDPVATILRMKNCCFQVIRSLEKIAEGQISMGEIIRPL